MMLLRKRLFFESVDVQTSHSQAIIGMPLLVPVPKNVIVNGVCFTIVKLQNKNYCGKNRKLCSQ
jgi:hypothetical protein